MVSSCFGFEESGDTLGEDRERGRWAPQIKHILSINYRKNRFAFLVCILVVFGNRFLVQVDAQFNISSSNYESIDYIGVFLLGSMRGAISLDVPAEEKRPDYFKRVEVARRTWAARVKHFYMVVGDSKYEKKAFKSPHCKNITGLYDRDNSIDTNKTLVYKCFDVHVLQAKECDGTGWGWKGPCCRAEAAMAFFLDMRATHGSRGYPNWFLFADDDYFVRLYKLHGVLTHAQVLALPRSRRAIAVTSSKDLVNGKLFYAYNAPFFVSNCTIPCTHRSTWMGFAVLSLEALLIMEEEVRSNGLQKVCRAWDVTHDIGLGLFVWMHAIASLPLCCGSQLATEEEMSSGVFFHKAATSGQPQALDKYFLPPNANDRTAHDFITRDFQEGREAFPVHGLLATAGIKTSLFYRGLVFREVLSASLNPKLLSRNPQLLPHRVTDYSPTFCTAEMEFHKKWRLDHSNVAPLRDVSRDIDKGHYKARDVERVNAGLVGTNKVKDELSMCLQYTEAVQNAPVHLLWEDLLLGAGQLPPADELERRRTRRGL